MIDFRSRVEYVGEQTEFLKGYKGIVTSRLAFTEEDDSYVEVTFIDDGATRLINVKNLKVI